MSRREMLIFFALLSLSAGMAQAHTGVGIVGGFASGFHHPIAGADHLIAMVAVGLWGSLLGFPAVWLLPIVFPLMMVCGGVLSLLGIPLPAVESGIATSVLVLGAMVALTVRLPLWATALMVGLFAIFHGHAHGSELPASVNPLLYSLGFVLATSLLHLTGIALGRLAYWPAGQVAIRAGGGLIALTGAAFLVGGL